MKRHLIQALRLGLIALIVWSVHGAAARRRPPEPVTLAGARGFFPSAVRLARPASPSGWTEVFDPDGRLLGRVLSTSPAADDIIGYAGPAPVLTAAGPDDRILGVCFQPNRETPANLRMIAEAGFLDGRNGAPWRSAADLKVDAVSGSTTTCAAVSAGLRRRLRLAADLGAAGELWLRFSWREAASLLVLAAALAVSFWPRLARAKGARLALQLASVAWLGFLATSMVSVALLAGWAAGGVPWRAAPAMVLIGAAALLLPVILGRQFYCTGLCPHGAAQELHSRASRWKQALPERLGRALRMIPGALLALMAALVIVGAAVPLEPFEPFSAYLLAAASRLPLVLALAGLIGSLFLARAWCHYGCATGALLRFLNRPGEGQGLGIGDAALGALAGLALFVRFWLS